jgi:four helix bundle protein
MAHIASYRQLEVWRKSLDLVERCYALVESLPPRRRFVFGDQILRAAVSIPANIAEGQRRPHRAYLNHLSIALGSQAELETHLEIARRLRFQAEAEISATMVLVESIGQMLHALTRSLGRL